MGILLGIVLGENGLLNGNPANTATSHCSWLLGVMEAATSSPASSREEPRNEVGEVAVVAGQFKGEGRLNATAQ